MFDTVNRNLHNQVLVRRRATPESQADGVTAWVESKLGFVPDRLQRQVLETRARRVLLNCCRQWGKSTVTAARAVYEGVTNARSMTVVVSPSARQTGEFVRKARDF